MSNKVVLAYSGGVDTSVAVKWLREKYNMDVIALTIDVGNEPDFTFIKQKALNMGAIKAVVVDAKKDYVNRFVFPALQANALYEGKYPLATALGRPLMAEIMVKVARKEGATAIAHGSTAKGNDQVRFDVGINTLAPDLKIIGVAREWGMTRDETIAYAKRHNIPLPVTAKSPYSIDVALWGRSCECGAMEDPWIEPPEDAFAWTKSPQETPDKPCYVEIEFLKGIPVSINGKKMNGIKLIQTLNALGGEHGVGRIDMIEDRLVGIKSRETYEAPAAIMLIKAHQDLESMVLSKEQIRFSNSVSMAYSNLIYEGLWYTSHRQDLDAYIKSTQRYVTGVIKIKLHKGTCTVVGRKSTYSLYKFNLATYDKGDMFDPADSASFIRLWGLSAKTQVQTHKDEWEKENKSGYIIE